MEIIVLSRSKLKIRISSELKLMNKTKDTQKLLNDAIVLDMCVPWGRAGDQWQEVLSKFRHGGFNTIFLTVGIRNGIGPTIKNIAEQNARWRTIEEDVILIRQVEDIYRAAKEDKLGIGYMFQGINPLESDLNMVEIYYQLGVRSIQLAYNVANPIADGCMENRDAGLSNLGVQLIEELNRVGMVVDCTHTGVRSTLDAVNASKDPVVITHSLSRALYDAPRNITDEQVIAIGESGGVIGVNGVGPFLSEHNDPTPERILQHLNHYVELIGADHVGIGLDYVEDVDGLMKWVWAHPEEWPNQPTEPDRYFSPTEFPHIVETLIEHGYSDHEIKGILGENFLRIFKRVWK